MDEYRLDEAEPLLEGILILAQQGEYQLGYPYQLMADLAFRRGNYPAAVAYSRRSHDAYIAEGDANGIAGALGDIGFYMMLTGDLEGGYAVTLEAQSQIAAGGDQNKYIYTLANQLLYHRCNGQNTQAMEALIRTRAQRDNDENLRQLLAYVLSLPCQSLRDGDPPKTPPPWPPN